MTHPVLAPGRVAVITGAASGIGLAAARRFVSLGMKVCLVDIDEDELGRARDGVAAIARSGADDLVASVTDVGDIDAVRELKDAVYERFGEVGLLMNNAVTRVGGGACENLDQWQRAVNVNLFGVINGVQTFAAAMIAQRTPCVIVNSGSKQGITNPPGNTAYNVSKAAVKTYTEGLQHELRNTQGCRVTAHLLVPGWTTTGKRAHKPGAWLPDQVIDVLLAALEQGDFYIICPDGEVTPEMDRARILWAAGDVVENRPPMSRWHPDYKQAFQKFCADGGEE
ncbi:MAG: SDR family NAD(P)-dependent oxidoreductase [Gammaproteobacteria bacterium]|nr:SDR family NAD(P)-dependent oxidoreductase [Gammaproteobacteria bacterium]